MIEDFATTCMLFNLMRDSLRAVFQKHEELEHMGLERMPTVPNQFNESPLVMDWQGEEIPIHYLVAYHKEHGTSFQIFSEEHGYVTIGEPPYRYTVRIDGIDGTYRYANNLPGYATLLSISKGDDPMYDDCLISGAMEHGTGRLFFGVQGIGAYIESKEGLLSCHRISHCTVLDRTTRIILHDYTAKEKRFREEMLPSFPDIENDSKCSAFDFTRLVTGQADVLVAFTKKDQLEARVMYLQIVEAGGVAITLNGTSVGIEKDITFGKNNDDNAIIFAATPELAESMRQLIVQLIF